MDTSTFYHLILNSLITKNTAYLLCFFLMTHYFLILSILYYRLVSAYEALITDTAITEPTATADAIPLKVNTPITKPPKTEVVKSSPVLEVFII